LPTYSRRPAPGGLFAAVAGERADGHDFAAAAVADGAVAVLATRPVPVPSVLVTDAPAALAALARFVIDALPAAAIAGITGSSGKTTTKDLAAQLIERLGPTIPPAGSFNNEFGHPLPVLRARTRPHRAPVPRRAAPVRRGAERGARARRGVRRAGPGRPGQGRAGRGAPGLRGGHLERG